MAAPRGNDDPVLADEPTLHVDPAVLARYGARVLDPATAVRVEGRPPPRPTVYVGDAVLVRGTTQGLDRDHLAAAADDLGIELEDARPRAERRTRLRASAQRVHGEAARERGVELLMLCPQDGRAVVPDAFQLLQGYHARGGTPGAVALDHLLTANRHVSPSPFETLGGAAPALSSYGQPGWGGRQPVSWLGPAPARPAVGHRRPVVAVLDTGVGEHDWFPFEDAAAGVERNAVFDGQPLGLAERPGHAVTGPFTDALEGTLHPYPGHGTFIAGLVRQQAPGADILSVRVMPAEGAVPEHVLLDALHRLALRQADALAGGAATRDQVVDVVSLSLGYYHEGTDDDLLDAMLLGPLRELGELGVAVVVAAGNDATSRPMYPAAFAPHRGGPVTDASPDRVPLVSVGALNPDGSHALFSNAGPWVTTAAPGAALVSTYPAVDGGAQPAMHFWTRDGWRASVDPDGFASGFAVWSGTSFAAPVVAGRVAAALLAAGDDLDDTGREAMTARAWTALSTCVPELRERAP